MSRSRTASTESYEVLDLVDAPSQPVEVEIVNGDGHGNEVTIANSEPLRVTLQEPVEVRGPVEVRTDDDTPLFVVGTTLSSIVGTVNVAGTVTIDGVARTSVEGPVTIASTVPVEVQKPVEIQGTVPVAVQSVSGTVPVAVSGTAQVSVEGTVKTVADGVVPIQVDQNNPIYTIPHLSRLSGSQFRVQLRASTNPIVPLEGRVGNSDWTMVSGWGPAGTIPSAMIPAGSYLTCGDQVLIRGTGGNGWPWALSVEPSVTPSGPQTYLVYLLLAQVKIFLCFYRVANVGYSAIWNPDLTPQYATAYPPLYIRRYVTQKEQEDKEDGPCRGTTSTTTTAVAATQAKASPEPTPGLEAGYLAWRSHTARPESGERIRCFWPHRAAGSRAPVKVQKRAIGTQPRPQTQ